MSVLGLGHASTSCLVLFMNINIGVKAAESHIFALSCHSCKNTTVYTSNEICENIYFFCQLWRFQHNDVSLWTSLDSNSISSLWRPGPSLATSPAYSHQWRPVGFRHACDGQRYSRQRHGSVPGGGRRRDNLSSSISDKSHTVTSSSAFFFSSAPSSSATASPPASPSAAPAARPGKPRDGPEEEEGQEFLLENNTRGSGERP